MTTLYTPTELVGLAVETEKGGRQFYEAAARDAASPAVKDLFLFLAAEEARHERTFSALHEKLKASPAELPYDWNEAVAYLRVITDSRFFLRAEGTVPIFRSGKMGQSPLAAARTAGSEDGALEFALQFEKETLLFYLELTRLVGPAHQAVLDELVRQERQHIRKLDEMRRNRGPA